jgi:hypothetical protein
VFLFHHHDGRDRRPLRQLFGVTFMITEHTIVTACTVKSRGTLKSSTNTHVSQPQSVDVNLHLRTQCRPAAALKLRAMSRVDGEQLIGPEEADRPLLQQAAHVHYLSPVNRASCV